MAHALETAEKSTFSAGPAMKDLQNPAGNQGTLHCSSWSVGLLCTFLLSSLRAVPKCILDCPAGNFFPTGKVTTYLPVVELRCPGRQGAALAPPYVLK